METRVHTVIIGTGFAGLLMGYRLKQAGRDDFVILEKADGVGGTWRENTYPGAECDVPSALYSYSFAPNPTWKFKFSKQAQILDYLNDFADREGLRGLIRHGREVTSCVWDEVQMHWVVRCANGETYHARHVVSAIGQLHIPKVPEFEGRTDYQGAAFHTAQWDHSVSHEGRDMAIIGNAASAIQVIPAVAPQVRKLTVYHRSPNWIIKKPDRPYLALEKWLLKRFPALSRPYRFALWCQGEYIIWPTIRGNRFTRWLLRLQNRWMLRKAFKSREMRARLTPDYPIGAKRILLSTDIYPALARDNVELVFEPIERLSKEGIRAGGEERAHDLIVFATGFETNPFLKMIEVRGVDGRSIREHWSDGAHAYLGVSTAGFPNFHMLYGPNTNTGHTSIVYKLEGQVDYVMQLIEAAGEGSVQVKPEVEERFNVEVQERLGELAFSKIAQSWYKDGDRVTNNWMGSSREFRQRLKTVDLTNYEVSST